MNMKMIPFILLTALAGPALGQPNPPDPTKVTSITEAANYCGLSEAGISWHEVDASTIQILLADASGLPSLLATGPLKPCFFPWAYDRNVKVEFGLSNKNDKQ